MYCSLMVVKIMALAPFESALQLPIGDPAVVFELLPFGGVNVVVDDALAEGFDQHFRFPERSGGLAQRLGHVVECFAQSGVAGERGSKL